MTDSMLVADGFATVKEAAKYLAIGKSRMYELIQAGAITANVHGGRKTISFAVLKAYAQRSIGPRGAIA